MNTAPEVEYKGKGKAPPPKTRLAQYREKGGEVLLPPVAAPYLIEWWQEIGPVGPDQSAISWSEMRAWQEVIGVEMAPWEARLIRSLSIAYLNQRDASRKADCPAPYIGDHDMIETRRDTVARQVKTSFGGLKAKIYRRKNTGA